MKSKKPEKPKKMGRPKLPKEDRRSVFIAVRFTKPQWAEISKKIAASGLSKQDWLRRATLRNPHDVDRIWGRPGGLRILEGSEAAKAQSALTAAEIGWGSTRVVHKRPKAMSYKQWQKRLEFFNKKGTFDRITICDIAAPNTA